jgi:hydroxymethylglutaryl-CoA reductase/oxepin-CoA hydrolase/3-oxo-5,6-dehydrosuberyl-CoA semialdehyde dehydrogenase
MNNQNYQVYADTFFKTDLIDKLKQLEDNQKPLWGIMTPQHMVEHIIGSWLISNGRFQVKLQTAAEKLTERRNFLFSDKEFQQNVQSAEGEPGKLNKLRKDNLLDAIISLQKEIITFYDYHNENPKTLFMHPVFGELNKEEWLLFQSKHIKYHLKQFSLL